MTRVAPCPYCGEDPTEYPTSWGVECIMCDECYDGEELGRVITGRGRTPADRIVDWNGEVFDYWACSPATDAALLAFAIVYPTDGGLEATAHARAGS